LTIVSGRVSHKLSGADVAATCGLALPAQGASYIVVTNHGTAPADISRITFSYVEMMTSSGAPTGACTVGVGGTEYITLTGIGADPASAGELFNVSLSWSGNGYASLQGTFV
jgi:sorbitol-specific phosphotransferase system component IIA